VRFSGEIDDDVGLVFCEYIADTSVVADVGVFEEVAAAFVFFGYWGEVVEIAGVGEFVEVDDFAGEGWFGEEVVDEVGADEAGTAGDEDGFHKNSLKVYPRINTNEKITN
jgi:hypothetical protein